MYFLGASLESNLARIIQIKRPLYLRSLCLTSRKIYDVTIPYLYKNIWLRVGGLNDSKVINLLNPRNPGLPYIRNVDFELDDLWSDADASCWASDGFDEKDSERFPNGDAGVSQQGNLMTRLLLEMIPENILRWACFGVHPVSRDNWALLCKRQKLMEVEGIYDVDLPWMPLLEQHPGIPNALSNLKVLQLKPYSQDSLQACQKFLAAHPKIEGIILVNDFGPGDNSSLMDSSTQPGLISTTLFSHMMPFRTCVPLNLKYLELHSITVRYASDTLLRWYVIFSVLFCGMRGLQLEWVPVV